MYMSLFSSNKLVSSIASDSTADVLALIADTSLDAAIESGALHGIPVIGMATGLIKAGRDIREAFLVKKLARFLRPTCALSDGERKKFVAQFENAATKEEFGAALLILIDRSEDIEKPAILGRLLVANVRGAFGRNELMRMSKMVDRSFFEDLVFLKTFITGLQPGNEIIAQSLTAIGFLYQAGFDGGDATEGSGGIWYEISQYGQWLAKYGLTD
ncbi:MAG TPA: hypothetical protein VGH80_07555 [Xanthomonadaceae bacterium]|jgi:hypothetical protein